MGRKEENNMSRMLLLNILASLVQHYSEVVPVVRALLFYDRHTNRHPVVFIALDMN